ncbi:hypothetical protein E2C01_081188 [Portunus trituberculatus]|uniref:Uncharacterized protein n=1 Tax=Portunus trituberculatus TaxID=210409 RepID=A0A5B7IVL2_PORTR|nr:hypothetical protein [Portunus trituberculatus]
MTEAVWASHERRGARGEKDLRREEEENKKEGRSARRFMDALKEDMLRWFWHAGRRWKEECGEEERNGGDECTR